MGQIYGRAHVTLVALTGNDSDHGLPGISAPRAVQQWTFALADTFLCQTIRPLIRQIHESDWIERGWTFQEYQASSQCLFFTVEGVFYVDYMQQTSSEDILMIYEESTGQGLVDWGHAEKTKYYTRMVNNYTSKTLTFPGDALRAFSGALYDNYQSRTLFGLPWNDFDRAILWYVEGNLGMRSPPPEAGVYPSWSWIAASGRQAVYGGRIHGLAYWARVQISDDAAHPVHQVVIANPLEEDLQFFKSKIDDNNDNKDEQETRVIAGLAWNEGCLRSPSPDDVLIDCSHERYSRYGNRARFSMTLPNQSVLDSDHQLDRSRHALKLDMQEIWRHHASVSYHDSEGQLMHAWDNVPKVHVMLIAPSFGKGKGTGVYQRLGLGVIYLKRWVEAQSKFESVVLE
ncbi:hypothetical protein EK21DRAFT_86584 [Setomelanomma holmii]|uniref:Heterokaryon incompatibility domain-containing protein n=1 Tax=Setomelanomma holmii TaxID=210430 RepID=A0A9P4HGI3_9PLEO|nr:hypothetical protein EK21DRAFT_86584 [Setomelanomma holmii]